MKRNIKWLGIFLSLYCVQVAAQISSSEVYKSLAYIEVSIPGQKSTMSTGFIWGNTSYVVTALHAMNPKASKITVRCGASESEAMVEALDTNADLVLLKTLTPLQRCQALTKKYEYARGIPPDGTKWTVYGYLPGVPAASPNPLDYKAGESNILSQNVTSKALTALTNAGVPDVNLRIYLVGDGIKKGFSGAPVFNKDGALIGIASGGLDAGASNHNWLVPVSNLSNLMGKIGRPKDIPQSLSSSASHFNATLADATTLSVSGNSSSENAQINEPVNDSYRWINTKTHTFSKIIETADPRLGLGDLYSNIVPEIVTNAEMALAFDIYEEESLGFIFAVPKDREVFIGRSEDSPYFEISSNSDGNNSDVLITYNAFDVIDDDDELLAPSDEYYMEYALVNLMVQAGCDTNEISCTLDRNKLRYADFGQGNKILRMAFFSTGYDEETESTFHEYNYVSFLVKGDDVLVVDTILKSGEQSPLMKCWNNETEDTCGQSFWGAASYALANTMTSFSAFVINNNSKVSYPRFEFECEDLCTN